MDDDWGGLDIEGLKDDHRADMAEIAADEARADHHASIRKMAVALVAKALGWSAKEVAATDGMVALLVTREEELLWEALDD